QPRGSELIIAPWTAMIQSAQLFGHYPGQAHETLGAMTTVIMRTSEGDMRMMLLLWDATPGNRSLKIVEIPIKTTLNNPDFPEK
ncbi:hypothetical protein, partial [Bifidobacterium adolescentis]|uniref:hypothetical protein n=1 Tax=Bifidobacterium adolescentis TaxID=1680 RepID=UPI001C8B8F86